MTNPRKQAAAAVALLRARGDWITSLEMIRAGIGFPERAVAFARQHHGAHILSRNQRGPGSLVEYRLVEEQLGLQLDAEPARERGQV